VLAGEAPDAVWQIAFIEPIAHPPSSGPDAGTWPTVPRDMVDLYELEKNYYLDARIGGSKPIEQVLPALHANSPFFRRFSMVSIQAMSSNCSVAREVSLTVVVPP